MSDYKNEPRFYETQVEPRLDVETVYSPHVHWSSRRGREWRAPCPVHGGRNPQSFCVNSETLVFFCQSCNAAGGPVAFLSALSGGPDSCSPSGSEAFALMRELGERVGVRPEDVGPLTPPPPRRAAPALKPKTHPPLQEVLAVLRMGVKPSMGCAATFEAWGIDAASVDDEVRVLPHDASLPRWAWSRGAAWGRDTYEIAFPLFGPDMLQPRCVLTRPLNPAMLPDPKAKTGCPTGHTTSGLVLANKAARDTIQGKAEWRECIVREGERDYLLDAQHGQPVIGTRQGAWTDALTEALPHGWHLEIATDPDEEGDKYAAEIVDSISRTGRGDISWSRCARPEAA